MPKARVHLLIVNYNTAPLLRRCVARVMESEAAIPYTITIVDNGSCDASVTMVRQEFPTVNLVESRRNLGFAGGNNLGLRDILARLPNDAELSRHYVLLLNTDLFVAPETLQVLVDFLDAHPDTAVVGPRVELRDGSLDLACRRAFPTPRSALAKLLGLSKRFPRSTKLAGYNLTHLDPNQITEVDSVMGACMLVRVAAITGPRGAGLLDEAFFMYGEDLDWAFRMKQRGWRVFYNPTTSVLHYKGATSSRRSERMIVEFYRAMYLFHRKHYARDMWRPLNWLVTVGIVARGSFAFAANLLRPAGRKRVA